MNEDTQPSTYQQANSFTQDPLDETTSTSDLTAPIVKRPFKAIEQVYLKAFIKLTCQKSKAQHHHRTLEEALRLERPPRGLTPQHQTQHTKGSYKLDNQVESESFQNS